MQIAASDLCCTCSNLERAVNQRLVQIYDHTDLPRVFRLHCRQQRLHLDLEIECVEKMQEKKKKKIRHKTKLSALIRLISEIWSSYCCQNRARARPARQRKTHLGDGPVLFDQEGGVVVDRLRLRLVPTQAAEKAGEEASAPGLLGGHGGRGACGAGRRRRRSEASNLRINMVGELLADPSPRAPV